MSLLRKALSVDVRISNKCGIVQLLRTINCAANSVLVCEVKKKLYCSCSRMLTRYLTCVRICITSHTQARIISSMLHGSSVTYRRRRVATLLSRNSGDMIDVFLGYTFLSLWRFSRGTQVWCTHKSCFLSAEEIVSLERNAEFNQE